MVERTSRYMKLASLHNASAATVLEGFSRRLRTVPPSLRKTLSYDQGTEMALHQDLANVFGSRHHRLALLAVLVVSLLLALRAA